FCPFQVRRESIATTFVSVFREEAPRRYWLRCDRKRIAAEIKHLGSVPSRRRLRQGRRKTESTALPERNQMLAANILFAYFAAPHSFPPYSTFRSQQARQC